MTDSACPHGHAPNLCPVTGCEHSRAQSLCSIPGCGEVAWGALLDGMKFCIRHGEKIPASTAVPPRVGESPRAAAGMVAGNVRGVGEDGKAPKDGAESWEFRKPVKLPDAHHTDPIAIGNETGWQQSPPVHVPGSPPKVGNGKGVMAGATRATERSDAGRDVDVLLAPLTEKERECYRLRRVCGIRRQEIAVRLGMTETAVKRALDRASAKVRREVPAW